MLTFFWMPYCSTSHQLWVFKLVLYMYRPSYRNSVRLNKFLFMAVHAACLSNWIWNRYRKKSCQQVQFELFKTNFIEPSMIWLISCYSKSKFGVCLFRWITFAYCKYLPSCCFANFVPFLSVVNVFISFDQCISQYATLAKAISLAFSSSWCFCWSSCKRKGKFSIRIVRE